MLLSILTSIFQATLDQLVFLTTPNAIWGYQSWPKRTLITQNSLIDYLLLSLTGSAEDVGQTQPIHAAKVIMTYSACCKRVLYRNPIRSLRKTPAPSYLPLPWQLGCSYCRGNSTWRSQTSSFADRQISFILPHNLFNGDFGWLSETERMPVRPLRV